MRLGDPIRPNRQSRLHFPLTPILHTALRRRPPPGQHQWLPNPRREMTLRGHRILHLLLGPYHSEAKA